MAPVSTFTLWESGVGAPGWGLLTKWFYGFDSRLVLGPVPKMLEMGVVPACMVLRMK